VRLTESGGNSEVQSR